MENETNDNLSEEFIEDVQRAIAEFHFYTLEKGYGVDLANDYCKLMSKCISKTDVTDYGALNDILVWSSSWGELQEVLVKDFLYETFIDVYRKRILKESKNMLYILAWHCLEHENNFLGNIFKSLRDFARDKVLLDNTDVNGNFVPEWMKGSHYKKKKLRGPGRPKDPINNYTFESILQDGKKHYEPLFRGYISTIITDCEDKGDVPDKYIITAFLTLIEEYNCISKELAHIFLKSNSPELCARFISKEFSPNKKIDKKTYERWLNTDKDNLRASHLNSLSSILSK